MPDTQPKVVFVDDDAKAGDLFRRFCRREDFEVEIFQEPEKALGFILDQPVDLVISDLSMPGMTGLELLEKVREQKGDLPFIVITAFSTVDHAIEALRLGASDFIKKPYDMDDLLAMIHTTLSGEEDQPAGSEEERGERYGMLGHSPAIEEIYRLIGKISDVRVNVIIEGESGTGKELAARAVHNMSHFADKPFIVIDCGALTDTLLESELFGHEKGAFTGATQTKPGLLEVASGGTVFLDEIGNISDAMQIKLLRVVQEQQVTRVGGVQPHDIDVRFIVASNRDLAQMVEDGQFRHDLYHRLNVVKLTMPPLRQRQDDIPVLLDSFVREFADRYHRNVEGFDADSVRRLQQHSWPGNVRELRNLVERHVALAEGPVLHLDQAPEAVQAKAGDADAIDADHPSLEELERRYIFKTLDRLDGNREQTAKALGINKSTLWRRLQQYEKPSGE